MPPPPHFYKKAIGIKFWPNLTGWNLRWSKLQQLLQISQSLKKSHEKHDVQT